MTPTEELLRAYRTLPFPKERFEAAKLLLERADVDSSAFDALRYILNEESDSDIRLAIIRFLESRHPPSAIRMLVKSMFDPDAVVRGHAAVAVSGYEDPRLLSWSLSELLDALPDPVTRVPAERAIRAITGRSSDKISRSERERIRRGEHPETIWPEYYLNLPSAPSD